MLARIQTLLSERFALQTHRDTREADVYVLTFASKDRALGKNIRRATLDCATATAAEKLALSKGGPAAGVPCGVSFSGGSSGTTMRYGGMTIAQIAAGFSRVAGRMVVDETALPGDFNVEVRYQENDQLSSGSAASIFTAVQEQLGLKLEPRRAQIPVLVIDRVERPSAN